MPSHSLLPYIYVVLGLYAVDALIEMSLISATVWWLHRGSNGPFEVTDRDGSVIYMDGHPARLITDQGHTSNGAAGTAFVLVGLGGLIALWMESRSRKKYHKSSILFYLWAVLVLLSCLLTLAALVFTFVVTAQTSHQTISLSALRRYPEVPYLFRNWTPQTWFAAVEKLPLVSDVTRASIRHYMLIMEGWRWNLIPLSALSLVLVVLVGVELWRVRREEKYHGGRGAYGPAAGDVEAKH